MCLSFVIKNVFHELLGCLTLFAKNRLHNKKEIKNNLKQLILNFENRTLSYHYHRIDYILFQQ